MNQRIFRHRAGLVGIAIAVAMQVACSGASSTPPDPYTSDSKATTASSANAPPRAATSAAPAPSGAATTAPSASTPAPPKGTPTTEPRQGGDADGENGAAGTIAVDEHCCFGGKYLRCPTTAACLGGFDLDACIDGCGFADVRCIEGCTSKLGNGGPVGCDATAAPPPGVDCANGTIDIGR